MHMSIVIFKSNFKNYFAKCMKKIDILLFLLVYCLNYVYILFFIKILVFIAHRRSRYTTLSDAMGRRAMWVRFCVEMANAMT